MDVSIIETSGLGDRSYLVSDGDVAVVVDPQRDIDRVLELPGTAACGSLTSSRPTSTTTTSPAAWNSPARTGAEYVVPAGDDVGYQRGRRRRRRHRRRARSGCRSCTPPATPTTTSATSCDDATARPTAVFTGGSMLLRHHRPHRPARRRAHPGADPRPVPLGAPARRRATRDTQVYPTHGFGSFCSATPASGDASTIGRASADQPRPDPGRTDLRRRTDRRPGRLPGLLRAHGRDQYRRARRRSTCRCPQPVDPDELRRRIEDGEWVVDLRDRTAFAAGHLGGTLGFELSTRFVTYLGWLYTWGAPLTLIGETRPGRRRPARTGPHRHRRPRPRRRRRHPHPRRRHRTALLPGRRLRRPRGGTARAGHHRPRRPPANEYDTSHIDGAINIPLHELADRLGTLPDGEIWVHCASGYRSSIAASMIDRPERTTVLVNDDYDNAKDTDITSTT